MEYEINRTRQDFYLKYEYWVQDTFPIDIIQCKLYLLMLKYEPFIWTSEYIAKDNKISSKTVKRMVKDMEEKEIIRKKLINNGSHSKWIIVPLYTINGRRSEAEVQRLLEEGQKKLDKLREKHYRITGQKTKTCLQDMQDSWEYVLHSFEV